MNRFALFLLLSGICLACQPNEFEATVTRYYTTAANEELFAIYKGTSASGSPILTKQGTIGDNSHTYAYSLCISRGYSYYITYHDLGNNGWSAGSYLHITVGDITIYSGRLARNTSDSDTFFFPFCLPNEVEATITRQYTTAPNEESFSIYRGTSATGSLVMMSYGTVSDVSKTYRYPICLMRGYSYFIAYYDSGNNGWSAGSYIQITTGELTLYKGRLATGSYGSDVIVYPFCLSNEIEAVVTRQYGAVSPNKESFSIYRGRSPSTGSLVMMVYGTELDTGMAYKYPICLRRGYAYSIKQTASQKQGWDSGSYIHITIEDYTIYKGTLPSGSSSNSLLVYPSCLPNEVEATVIRQYGVSNMTKETTNIYRGRSPSTGSLVMSVFGTSLDSGMMYKYHVCLRKGYAYTVELKSNEMGGWSSDSYVQVVAGDFTLYKGRLPAGSVGYNRVVYPECLPNEVEATLTRQYGVGNAIQESFKFYQGSSSSSSAFIIQSHGTELDSNKVYKYPVCIVYGQPYTIEFFSANGSGWESGSYIQVGIDEISFYRDKLASGESSSATFTPSVTFVSTSQTQWKYTDVPQANSDWAKITFSDNGWSTATAGTFPSFTTMTRYYRLTGTLANRNQISTLISSINNRYGFVLYLQGTEVYRYHMNSGSLTFATPATLSDGTYYVRTSANKFLLPQSGSFVLAYEVHLTAGVSNVEDPFACSAYFSNASSEGALGSSMFYDGISASVPPGNVDNLFDTNLDTFYQSLSSGTPIFTYQFNNGRAEWLNYYSVANHELSTASSYPTSWTLSGSNDGQAWTTLDTQSNIVFTSSKQTLFFSLRHNTMSYNRYQLAITSSSLPTSSTVSTWHGFTGMFATQAPFRLTYPEASTYTFMKTVNVSIVPSYDVADLTFSIMPLLPSGLSFDIATGAITGAPVVVSPLREYTIIASNPSGSVSFKFNIEVVTAYCESEGGWPRTELGQQATAPCDSAEQVGHKFRSCSYVNGVAAWQNVENTCTSSYLSITYPQLSYIFYNGVMIPEILPIVVGLAESYSVNPPLPNGMVLNPQTGSISGTPTVGIPAQNYVITVYNEKNSASVNVVIEIRNNVCNTDGVWPSTPVGQQATIACDSDDYEGQKIRMCNNSGGMGIWGNIVDQCTLKTPVINYPQSSYTFIQFIPIETVIPITQYRITSYSINPPLGNGLIFNTNNGQITGTPLAYAPSTPYTITVLNEQKSASVVIFISVADKTCDADGVWPATPANQVAVLPCEQPELYTGNRTRTCIDAPNSYWSEVTNNCVRNQCPSETIDGVVYPATDTGTTITVGCPPGYLYGHNERACNLNMEWSPVSSTCILDHIVCTPTIASINLQRYQPVPAYSPNCNYTPNSYTLQETLPVGLSFNPTTGIISGSTAELFSVQILHFTPVLPNYDGSFSIILAVTESYCSQDSEWSQTAVGQTASASCPVNYHGTRTRLCKPMYPPQWDTEVNTCTMNPPVITAQPSYSWTTRTPSGISFNGSDGSTSSGIIQQCSIAPPLPAGLVFSTTDCSISGTPTIYSPLTSYTITASNSDNPPCSIIVGITVLHHICESDGSWIETTAGETRTLPCDDTQLYYGNKQRTCVLADNSYWGEVVNTCQRYKCPSNNLGGYDWPETETGNTITYNCPSIYQTGSVTRTCPISTTPTWGSVVNTCLYMAPNLHYNSIVNLYHYNEPITPLIPTCVGECTSYSISPSLPSGLTINTSTGIISGAPLEVRAQTDFTITVSNRDTSSSFIIKIKVIERLCAQDGIWEATAYGNTAYAFCENSNSLTQYRECLLNDLTTSWGEINSSMCASSSGGGDSGSTTTTTLPEEPEKGHAFIQFYLTYLEKNPEDYTPQNLFALYNSLFTYFENGNTDIDGIVITIESLSTSFWYQATTGSIIHVTVGVSESEVTTIKEELTEYVSTSYYEDIVTKDPSFGTTPFEFKPEQMTTVHAPLITLVEILIIIVVIICVILLFCILFIWYVISLRSKKRHPMIEQHTTIVETTTTTRKTVRI